MNSEAIEQSLLASLPEILLLAAACLLLLLDLLLKGRRVDLIAGLSILIVLAVAAVTWVLEVQADYGSPVYNNMFVADPYSVFFKMIFYIATVLTILISSNYLKLEDEAHGEYFVLLLFALCGMMIMASAIDLISIYVGMELLALSMYVLTGFLKKDQRSNESALKYLILSATATCLMLYGISLFYGLCGTTQLNGITDALTTPIATAGVTNTLGTDPAMILATLFLLGGFAFKIAAVPFHMWAPDVYEGAPTPITAFMSVGSKAAGFAVLLRIFVQALAPLADIWLLVFGIIALATMAVGSLVALVQTNIKRLLAYSSIAHAGFALLGLIAGGENGVASVLLYLLIFTFMNLGIFTVIVAMKREDDANELISDYSGLSKQQAVLALLMLLFLFSLAGIPPTAGFIAKFYIIIALIEARYILLAVAAVLFSAIAAFFYLRIVMLMYMREPFRKLSRDNSLNQPLALRLSLAVTGIATLGIGLFPAWFLAKALAAVF
jgi:NADH-quinone oxidoreductase subunit N